MKKRALIVDDNADSRAILRDVMEGGGFDIAEAVDGREALDRLRETRPHVILLDLEMPRLDGWETARRIKKQGDKVPVIAVTAHALKGDRDKALAAGCDDYVAKPCHPLDVLRKAEEWTNGEHKGDQP